MKFTNDTPFTDGDRLKIIRANVGQLIKSSAEKYDGAGRLLDIGPSKLYESAKDYFHQCQILTLDIDPTSEADYIADLTEDTSHIIPEDYFDFVVCTEVLEHTTNPFNAVREIRRILKKGGKVIVSTPFDFQVHDPRPDCWRFTEDGLRVLFQDFNILSLENLFIIRQPLHFTLVAEK